MSLRLDVERQHSVNAYFLTFTYAPEHLPRADTGFPTLKKSDIQEFLTRVRNASRIRINGKRYNCSPRWFIVGEYGSRTERPHYHALLFNVLPEIVDHLPNLWSKGRVHVGAVSRKSVRYCTKYSISKNKTECIYSERVPPFMIVTKKPYGLGGQWLTDENKKHQREILTGQLRDREGRLLPLPRYYRDRVGFTFEEKTIISLKIEAEMQSRHDREYSRLKALGYADPIAELSNRELEYERALEKRLLKLDVI